MKIIVALALIASITSAWEIPEDAYTQFPIEHLPRDETGGIDHGRELWKYWEPPKPMTECFDYDKCKSCWMKECVEEADDAFNACRKWDAMKTDWMMQEGGKCEKEKLNPSKAGDRDMCQDYGECVYKDCGYDCDNVRHHGCCVFVCNLRILVQYDRKIVRTFSTFDHFVSLSLLLSTRFFVPR